MGTMLQVTGVTGQLTTSLRQTLSIRNDRDMAGRQPQSRHEARATKLVLAVFVNPIHFQTHLQLQSAFCFSWSIFSPSNGWHAPSPQMPHATKTTLDLVRLSRLCCCLVCFLLCPGQNTLYQPPTGLWQLRWTYGQPQLSPCPKRQASGTGILGRSTAILHTQYVGLSGLGSVAARDPLVTTHDAGAIPWLALLDSIRVALHIFFFARLTLLPVCLSVCLPFLLARSFVNSKPTSISVWTLAIGCLDGLPLPRHTTIHQTHFGDLVLFVLYVCSLQLDPHFLRLAGSTASASATTSSSFCFPQCGGRSGEPLCLRFDKFLG